MVAALIEDHLCWAVSIAKSVARAWNMDWELDGLDGGANEALLFCATRFDPSLGVPFRAYARRRVHEAATEEARKSKHWQRQVGSNSEIDQQAREVSAFLFELFPELRDGLLPEVLNDDSSGELIRRSVRQLLVSASLFSSTGVPQRENPEKLTEYRHLIRIIAQLENVHQQILWSIYWQGTSQRSLAEQWHVDELAIIREHRDIIEQLGELYDGKSSALKKIKIRPVLRKKALELHTTNTPPPFRQFINGFVLLALLGYFWILATWILATWILAMWILMR